MRCFVLHSRKSAAALSTVLLVGAIVVEAAVASLVASYLVSQEGLGLKLSYDATVISRSGLNDALLKVIRNGSGASAQTYQVAVENWSSDVVIAKSVLGNNDIQFVITATAAVLNKHHTTRAVVIVDSVSGLAQIESVASIVP